MSQTCPNCGFANRATNRFCSNCGVALVPTSQAGEDAPTSSSRTTSADTEPVTYMVRTWDAPEPVIAPPVGATTDGPAAIPPPPALVPYGGYASTSPTTVYGTGASVPPAPPTVAPGRAEGGTYAPYSADAARKLEAQKPARSWLVPSVAAAGLLLVLLLAVGAFLLLQPKNGTNVNSAGTSGQGVPAGASDEDTIKAVIKQSNDEQITAWRTLDTEVLKGTRTGQVLTENIQAVQELQSKGMYAIPENKRLDYGEIKVTGDTATAKTVEVWTVTFYTKGDGKVVLATGPDTLQETYYLVKQNGKWLVNSLDIQKQNPPGTPSN